MLSELLGLVNPVHADHQGKVPRPSCLDASQRVLEDGRGAGRPVEFSAAARNVSGAGLPRSPRSEAVRPSTRTSNRPASPAESRICLVLALEDTIAVEIPLSRTERM